MYILFFFFFGLVVGSFLNALIWRLHSKESVVFGRSMCPHCRQTLSAKDLVPLLSFAYLRGRCRHCQAKISWQYPLVELVTALLFVLAYALQPQLLTLTRNLFLLCVLIVIFVYDLRWQLILDRVTIPAIAIIFVLNLFLGNSIWSLLLAAAVGFGFFGLQYLASSGRWIGGGDLRLGVLMGVALGWPNILVGLLLAYIIGAAVALALLLTGNVNRKTPIAFGTFLAVGSVIALFWGEQLINWYFSLAFNIR